MEILTPDEECQFATAKKLIIGSGEPESKRVRAQYITGEVAKLVSGGTDPRQAEQVVKARCTGHLSPDDTLQSDDGLLLAVKDILASPETYNGMTFRDPLEPEAGSCKAKFYSNVGTGNPVMHSQLHGGVDYVFRAPDLPAWAGKDGKGFKLVPAHEVIKNVKSIEWLVGDIIERHSFAELFGDSGTYKSFVALDIALCVATGTPFHGRPVTQGPVVIVIGEGLHGYGRRLAAWQKHHGIDLADYPVFVSSMAAQFLDDESAAEVESAIAEVEKIHGKVELVLIDTLNRNFGPGDENGSKDMTQFIAALDRRIGNDVTRLIIHHTGHSNKERARGSYVLPAALDCEIQVSKKGGTITLINTKQKDAPEFLPINFETVSINLDENGIGDLLNPVTSLVLQEIDGSWPIKKLTHAQQKVYDIVVSKTGTNCSKKHLFESLHLSQESLSTTGTPEAEKKAMQRSLRELISNGYIREISEDCYTTFQRDNRDMSGTN
ncbi:MAG: AAA family ATPase [Desulfoprunum sp.]|nr:AAA family ATPase [Desulfoprunum sp.]